MLKIASLVTATILLSSCSSTVEELYQKVAPRPAVVTSQEDVSATQERVLLRQILPAFNHKNLQAIMRVQRLKITLLEWRWPS